MVQSSLNKNLESLITDLRIDIEILHAIKMKVSSKTAHLLQHIIDSHLIRIRDIYKRNDMAVPQWCDE